jgi:hypothetical protein
MECTDVEDQLRIIINRTVINVVYVNDQGNVVYLTMPHGRNHSCHVID